MRHLFCLCSLLLVVLPVRAENWRSDKLAIFMIIPEAPEWQPFQSSDPNAVVSRGRVDRTALFVLTAKPVPAGMAATEMTAEFAQAIYDGFKGSLRGATPMERTTINGLTAFRSSATMAGPSGQPVHREFLFWIYYGHIFGFDFLSTAKPVAEHKEFGKLVESVRFLKK